jgi:hypothetical protein
MPLPSLDVQEFSRAKSLVERARDLILGTEGNRNINARKLAIDNAGDMLQGARVILVSLDRKAVDPNVKILIRRALSKEEEVEAELVRADLQVESEYNSFLNRLRRAFPGVSAAIDQASVAFQTFLEEAGERTARFGSGLKNSHVILFAVGGILLLVYVAPMLKK